MGAFVYMFSGFMLGHFSHTTMLNTACLLPFVCLFFWRFLGKQDREVRLWLRLLFAA